MSEVIFLTIAEVLELHEEQIALYGDPGIRDMGLVESAVATPMATFGGEYLHPEVFTMAAAYAFHVAESQAFIDGNKRTRSRRRVRLPGPQRLPVARVGRAPLSSNDRGLRARVGQRRARPGIP